MPKLHRWHVEISASVGGSWQHALSSVSSTSVAATDRLQKLLTERVLEEVGVSGQVRQARRHPLQPRRDGLHRPPKTVSARAAARAGGTIPRTRSAALNLCHRVRGPGKTALQTHFLAPQLVTCSAHLSELRTSSCKQEAAQGHGPKVTAHAHGKAVRTRVTAMRRRKRGSTVSPPSSHGDGHAWDGHSRFTVN